MAQNNNQTESTVKAVTEAAKHARKRGRGDPPMFYPTCRFCGKQSLPLAPYDCQADADEAATITCDCYKARQYQDEVERLKQRANNINKLRKNLDDLSGYCEKRGADLQGALYDLLLNAGIAVLDNIVASASFKFNRLKVNITTNSKGAIVIGFTYSDGAKVEV